MDPFYTLSLAPVIAVALLLFFSAALYCRHATGLIIYSLSVAVWAGALLACAFPEVAGVGRRMAAVGAFVSAAYIHAAYDFTQQARYMPVWLAYGAAAVITLMGVVFPGALYDPATLQEGPYYWHAIGLAVVALSLPLYALASSFEQIERERHTQFAALFLAGVLGYMGS